MPLSSETQIIESTTILQLVQISAVGGYFTTPTFCYYAPPSPDSDELGTPFVQVELGSEEMTVQDSVGRLYDCEFFGTVYGYVPKTGAYDQATTVQELTADIRNAMDAVFASLETSSSVSVISAGLTTYDVTTGILGEFDGFLKITQGYSVRYKHTGSWG